MAHPHIDNSQKIQQQAKLLGIPATAEERLQRRIAELEQEVEQLKKQTTRFPEPPRPHTCPTPIMLFPFH